MNCFFGVEVNPGETIAHTPSGVMLRVSQAALAHHHDATTNGKVTLYCSVGGLPAYALGTLSAQHGKYHFPIHAIFMPGQELQFSTQGDKIRVHVTGYYDVDNLPLPVAAHSPPRTKKKEPLAAVLARAAGRPLPPLPVAVDVDEEEEEWEETDEDDDDDMEIDDDGFDEENEEEGV